MNDLSDFTPEDAYAKGKEDGGMTAAQFRALLNLWMCSDPWPASQDDSVVFDAMMAQESTKRGYSSIVDAYHEAP